jgi:hypothetical protein
VELTIRWPVLLDQATRLNWVVRGHIVRQGAAGCAVRISSQEFRTRGSAASPTEKTIAGACAHALGIPKEGERPAVLSRATAEQIAHGSRSCPHPQIQ